MKATFSIVLVVIIVSANGEFLHGDHHLTPTGNLVSSRTIVAGAVGGGPSAGAFSSAQYSQTVAAPATVHTVISTHPVSTYPGYASSSNNQNANINNANNGVPYSSYEYSSGQGVGIGGVSGGQLQNPGYSQGQNAGYSQPAHYNQRY